MDPPARLDVFFTLISKRVRLEEIIATEKSSHGYTDTTKQIIHSFGHTQFHMLSLANSQALIDSNIISPTFALTHTHTKSHRQSHTHASYVYIHKLIYTLT